jgi:hypothetical protein
LFRKLLMLSLSHGRAMGYTIASALGASSDETEK